MSVFSFVNKMESSDNIHIGLNFSPLFDMKNGRYYKGFDGKEYLNGGITHDNALVGGSNTQKTGLLVFSACRFLYRFPMGIVIYADIESTMDVGRLAEAVDRMYNEEGYFYEHIYNKRFFYKSGDDEFDGTAFHNLIKAAYANFKENKNNKELYVTTPFLTPQGKRIEIVSPIMVMCDSLSEMRFNEAAMKFVEGDVDEGGKKRTRDLETGNLKRVVFEDSHALGGIAGLRLWWVGQVKDVLNMTGQPMEKESTFIRHGKKIDKCPRAILKQPHIGLDIIRGAPLKSDQEWMYPNPHGRDVIIDANARENPDLLMYSFTIFRNKGGTSGIQGSFIGSQSDGIQEGLSMYHILKTNGRFGLQTGSVISHACDLLPDLKLGRTTIRYKIGQDNLESHKLYRAITICYQMWYMQTYWLRLDHKYRMTPQELYEKMIARGYDWNKLLENSVDFWHLNPVITQETLTTKEILNIALGESEAPWAMADKTTK